MFSAKIVTTQSKGITTVALEEHLYPYLPQSVTGNAVEHHFLFMMVPLLLPYKRMFFSCFYKSIISLIMSSSDRVSKVRLSLIDTRANKMTCIIPHKNSSEIAYFLAISTAISSLSLLIFPNIKFLSFLCW